MSTLVAAELSAACDALGRRGAGDEGYRVSSSTVEALRELVRFLHRDGEEHEVRRVLGRTDVLQTDLAPLLLHHAHRHDLFNLTLRLIINLTNPVLALYREEVPIERTDRHNYLEILSHLQKYKAGVFTTVEFWKVFAEKLIELLQTDWKERDDDTSIMIERILILIRNALHVPSADDDTRPDNDASVHDQLLWALNQSGMLDVIQYMCSENEKQYFMHILEIISLLLREQNPTSLASAALQRSVDEKLKDEQELLSIRTNEMKQRNNKVRQFSASRHSRFGGTYVVQNMKSISDNDVICLKPLNKISNLDFGGKKEKLKRPKNRRPVETESIERRSSFSVRLVLKQFCEDFLNCSYNPLMHYVKDALVRSKGKQNDESYYLWALKFFMEFNRGNNFNVALVSETLSVQMFHYIQQQIENYLDMIKVDKKKFAVWVKRMHLALKAYKELLNTLAAMDKCRDETVRETAKVLKSNIFYVLEYREFMITTFLMYDENKMPRAYLVDLVEMAHLFLKMLEHFCKKTGLVVQKKIKRKNKKKKSANKPTLKSQKPSVPEPPHWEEVRPQVSVVLQMSELPHMVPFDAASETPIDEQRAECIKNIQKHMMEGKYEEAVGMLRAAREVWPEEGIFGVPGLPADEELNMMENIYVADLGVELSENGPEHEEPAECSDGDDDEEEDEAEHDNAIEETDFDFSEFTSRFCNPRVTSACAYLLEQFDKNIPHTNHCALKLLHRVAWDNEYPSMLYQASLFRTFQRILDSGNPQFKELEKFAIFILRKFTEAASKEPKIFLELLFWKNQRDAREIKFGYAKYDGEVSGKGKWSEEQEDELRKLYMENQTNPQTDQDVIDWIMDNLIDQTRTRRAIIKKLKELGLIFRAPTKKSHVKEKVPLEFSEEEDEMLRRLWEKYGETNDPMGAIVNRMPAKRQKRQFVDRLLELNIIQNVKQAMKKRSKKSADGSGVNTDSDGDSDSRASPQPLMNKPNKKSKKSAPVASGAEIAKVLIQAVDKDLSEALMWLAECLEEVALDQEAEGYNPTAEGVPLVPISAESVGAMDEEVFQQALIKLGIEPPGEQEMFWRIPSKLTFETMRKRREVILKAVDKTLIVTEEIASSNTENYENLNKDGDDKSSGDDDNVFDNLRKIREANVITTQPNKSKYNKRTRSPNPEAERSTKIQKIDEVNNESNDDSDEDILSFAKKTLPGEDMPNTEDLFNNLLEESQPGYKEKEGQKADAIANSSDEENFGVSKKKRKSRVIQDDSD